jgi:hypothetical protein
MSNGKHYMVQRGVIGSLTELVAPFAGDLAKALAANGWEAATPGAVFETGWRCPVNGEGVRYKAQEMLDGAGKLIGTVNRYDLGTNEI